jgi:hypothetical protein
MRLLLVVGLLALLLGPQVSREVKRRRLRAAIVTAGERWPSVVADFDGPGSGRPNLFFVGGNVGNGFPTSAPYVVVAFDAEVFAARQISGLGVDETVVLERTAAPAFRTQSMSMGRGAIRVTGQPLELRSGVREISRALQERGWHVGVT